MESVKKTKNKKWAINRMVIYLLTVLFFVVGIMFIYMYNNFNKIFTEAIYSAFNSNIISNVYELKFKKLRINILKGNIQVLDVELQPREKPLVDYPYINSSFSLKTSKILLKDIELMKLFNAKKIDLSRIEILNPVIVIKMAGNKVEFIPYKDSTLANSKEGKKQIGSYFLAEFDLINASIHSENTNKERKFHIDSFNVSIRDVSFKQQTKSIGLFLKHAEVGIGKFKSMFKKDDISNLNFVNFNIKVDSIDFQKTPDTITYHFKNCAMDMKDLVLYTADSVFQIALKTFQLSCTDKSLQINGFSFKPDITKTSLLENYKYQLPPIFTVSAGIIQLNGLNIDTLLYKKKLYVEELLLNKVDVYIIKDKKKAIDFKHIEEYPGQKIKKLKLPVWVKSVKATNITVDNQEFKPDGTIAKVKIQNISAEMSNVTNMDSINPLVIKGTGCVENKACFEINLAFSYGLSQFTFNGKIKKFELKDLNPLLKYYAPLNINKGFVDEITFSGIAHHASSSGTLTFLYHDLDIDLQLKERAKWQSDILTFAANTYINNANPVSANQPPRIVKFDAKRDMNKGFLNIVLKSIFAGIKQTILMSKENRKSYQGEKDKWNEKNN